ncbi:MAG: hypothetical protein J1F11_00960 [Oscillospiraceae bacterium]|nr:hypothetical protein [Oscillospiraceae bacterium]
MKKLISMLSAILLLSGCGHSEVLIDDVERSDENVSDILMLEEAVTESGSDTAPENERPAETQKSETISLPDDNSETVYDIFLRASNTEIHSDPDEAEIIWYAEIPIDCEPEKVGLVDADTGEIVSELFDEADFEKYGDTIKGDSVYNCRFTVNTDIDTDPDVSEDRYYHFYACFTENGITHCSETVEIWVYESFSDKELYDMEAVDTAVSELMDSDGFNELSAKERSEQMLSLISELSEKGTPDRPYSLIDPESIFADEDMISFQYACGVSGGVKLTPFSEYMN